MSKAPITNPNSTAAPSGPSASKGHGAGAGPESQNRPAGKATLPPSMKATPTLGSFDGSEAAPVKNDYGQGVKRPAISNNDLPVGAPK